MAQTQNAISFVDAVVEISIDNATWTDISGFTNSLKIDGGERAVSEFFTLDGDTPILTKGKRSSLEINVSALYTETAGEAFDIVDGQYQANGPLYVRWAPKGSTTGNLRYTSSKGIPTKPVYPGGEASSSDAVPMEFTVKVASIAKAAIAP